MKRYAPASHPASEQSGPTPSGVANRVSIHIFASWHSDLARNLATVECSKVVLLIYCPLRSQPCSSTRSTRTKRLLQCFASRWAAVPGVSRDMRPMAAGICAEHLVDGMGRWAYRGAAGAVAAPAQLARSFAVGPSATPALRDFTRITYCAISQTGTPIECPKRRQ
jgi:hypothetical protein